MQPKQLAETLGRTVIKPMIQASPTTDAILRRLVWKRLHPPLYYHEPESRLVGALAKGAIDVAIDVGAATGSYSWILRRSARDIVAFEPGASHRRALRVASVGMRISVQPYALSNRRGEAQLRTPNVGGDSRYYASLEGHSSDAESTTIATTLLDDWLSGSPYLFRSIDFIKIDVEGHELGVLEGACKTIHDHHPVLLVEIEPKHNPSFRDVFSLAADSGYDCLIFERDRGLIPFKPSQDPDLPLGGYYNFVFIHPLSRAQKHFLDAGSTGLRLSS